MLIGLGLLSYASFRLTGGFCLSILLGTAVLAVGRRHLLRAVAGVSIREIPHAGEVILRTLSGFSRLQVELR